MLSLLLIPYVQAAEGGSVRGTVTDETELGIPGATVVLSGPLIAGELQATTDDDGNFRFVSAPVGTHTLKVLKTGFPSAERRVRVKLEETAFVEVSLTVGAEVMVIEDTQPVLDTSRSAVSTEMSKEALDNLDQDRAFLKKGGVMDDDFIDSYIELKMEEVMRLQLHPHPVEFDMYYSY